MTDAQIEEAISQLRIVMHLHKYDITSDAAQKALGMEDLGMELFRSFRDCAEADSHTIVRTVPVDRSLNLRQATRAMSAHLEDNTAGFPSSEGEGDKVRVVFFKLDVSQYGRTITDEQLEDEFEKRGLRPADAISIAAVNQDDPEFVGKRPHATHWKSTNGKWCYVAFRLNGAFRSVIANVSDNNWKDHRWWFAGIAK
ncbi:MAG: hypothetical protein RL094_386 [Candidatus Parcubacteria bacterium]